MVCSRLPQGFITLHPFKTDQDILHGLVQGMSHVKLASYIWRGHDNGKRFFIFVYFCVEIFVIQPFLINAVFQTFWVISFCKLFAHSLLLLVMSGILYPKTFLGICIKNTLHNHLIK